MTVKLVRDARIKHKAGETVEVSSEEYAFLTSLGSAVDAVTETVKTEVEEKPATLKKTTRKK